MDLGRWIPHYLPHWSTRERSAARYAIADGRLSLLITANQQPWCPDLDGEVRVSSLQTGVFAGPVGSTVGQHRFKTVRQSPGYPMQLMLGIYEFPEDDDAGRASERDYPKSFVVDYVRGYRLADGSNG